MTTQVIQNDSGSGGLKKNPVSPAARSTRASENVRFIVERLNYAFFRFVSPTTSLTLS